MVPYNSFLRLADAVLEQLEAAGPLRIKEIADALRRSGWGSPPSSAVKVLAQYLVGKVKRDGRGRWSVAGD